MEKRVITTIMLVVLVFTNVSCTKIAKLSADEVRGKSRGKISVVASSSGIKGVTLHSGELVAFDNQGGKIDAEQKIVRGISPSGEPIEIKLDTVRNLQINQDAVINFDRFGGKFDAETQLITGTTTDGKPVEIPLDDVLYIKARKFDVVMTSVLIGLPVALVVYGILTFELPEGSLFGDNGNGF